MNGKDRFGKMNGEIPKGDQAGMNSSRARNRTVMLTPEMTGQVRSLLSSSEDSSFRESDISGEEEKGDGFTAPVQSNSIDDILNAKFEDEDGFKALSKIKELEKTDRASQSDRAPQSDRASQATGHFGGRSGTLTDLSRLIDAPKGADAVKQSINNLLSIGRESMPEPERRSEEKKSEDRATGFHARPKIFEDRNVAVSQTQTSHNQSALVSVNNTASHNIKNVKVPTSRIIGFLISFDKTDNGEILEIREGRSHISSKVSDQDELIVIEDPTISALHAVIKASGNGDVLLLDQLSEHGSGVMHQGSHAEEDAAGVTVKIFHGDVVRLGRRYFIYCGVPKLDIRG